MFIVASTIITNPHMTNLQTIGHNEVPMLKRQRSLSSPESRIGNKHAIRMLMTGLWRSRLFLLCSACTEDKETEGENRTWVKRRNWCWSVMGWRE